MKVKNLGVAILPDDKLKNQLMKMSKILRDKYKVSYILDNVNFHHHLTIYQSKFKSYNDLEKSVRSFTSNFKGPVEVILDNISIFSESFVFLICKKTESLQRLHDKLTNKLKELVAKDEAPLGKEQNLVGLTEKETYYMMEYGYPFVRESFNPHFTLGRVVNQTPNINKVRNILLELTDKLRGYTFSSTEIVIYEVGIDGSCIKILNKFVLK